jgi:hypothetical protein
MPAPNVDTIVLGGVNSMIGNVSDVPSHADINEKARLSHSVEAKELSKDGALVDDYEIKTAPTGSDGDEPDKSDSDDENAIIVTGADAALHLLPLRDDGDPALTFRAMFLATGLAGFQAAMNQIYYVSDEHRCGI